jgi:hypothetical protein
MVMWVIWNNRNNYVWNDSRVNARQVGYQARQLWDEWAAVNGAANTHQQLQNMTAVAQWQTPVQGRLKCNVDASFYDAEGATGWGWCICDHHGSFIVAGSNFTHQRLSIVEGEATTIKEAICEAIRQGFSHVTFERTIKFQTKFDL